MPKLSQEKIDEIRQSVDIVEIVKEYVPLVQRGRNYFGVCPFHQDHSPSMSVSKEKQLFKCFSCGMAGNVFKFVSEYENISYIDAVARIAAKSGISVDINTNIKPIDPWEKEYDLMNLTMLYFKNNLNTSHGKEAKEYLKERGLNEEIQAEFDIGLSLKDNQMLEFLKKKKKNEKDLLRLGLVNQNGLEYTDVFKNRIIFPIHDIKGHVVGFIGRVYKENKTPKYLNSKETEIFKKGNILFNFHRAKEFARLKKELIIVEGNMDAIRMYASGIQNTIALQGTSLTKEQINIIQRLHVSVILLLDNDEAGETATLHNGELLEKSGINVCVVRLSGEKDPDEYILKNGVEKMVENLEHPLSYLEFKLKVLKKNKNLEDSKELSNYVKEVLNSIKGKDKITVDITLKKLSEDYPVSYEVLQKEFENMGEIIPINSIVPQVKNKNAIVSSAEAILYCMMNDKKCIKMYQTKLGYFKEAKYRGIANEILYYFETHQKMILADFLSYAETSPLKNEIYQIIHSIKDEQMIETNMEDFIFVYQEKTLKNQIVELKRKLKETFDKLEKDKIVEKILNLKKKIEEMKIERSVKND